MATLARTVLAAVADAVPSADGFADAHAHF